MDKSVSFIQEISREIKVSTPTVKARYERLVNVGLIKGVSLILDLGKLDSKISERLDHIRYKVHQGHGIRLDKGVIVKMTCDYCKGSVQGKPSIFKFANMERFFCCISCRTLYKEKYKGRIESLSNTRNIF